MTDAKLRATLICSMDPEVPAKTWPLGSMAKVTIEYFRKLLIASVHVCPRSIDRIAPPNLLLANTCPSELTAIEVNCVPAQASVTQLSPPSDEPRMDPPEVM